VPKRIGHQRVQDRRRIGEPGRLDDDPSEMRYPALHPAYEQIDQSLGDVAAHRAAQAAAVEQHDIFARPLDQ
jgi:hypothetical protein